MARKADPKLKKLITHVKTLKVKLKGAEKKLKAYRANKKKMKGKMGKKSAK